mmetsp:Transcript_31948/g.68862  ORF Transcript_31948/g.68862 Transcript_31948/m.68862 type:complete len:257 (+) Transcript_31948:1908-2678(+)
MLSIWPFLFKLLSFHMFHLCMVLLPALLIVSETLLARATSLQGPRNTGAQALESLPSRPSTTPLHIPSVSSDGVMLQHVLEENLHRHGSLLASLHTSFGLSTAVGQLNLRAYFPCVVPPARLVFPLPRDMGVEINYRSSIRVLGPGGDPVTEEAFVDMALRTRIPVTFPANLSAYRQRRCDLCALRRRLRWQFHMFRFGRRCGLSHHRFYWSTWWMKFLCLALCRHHDARKRDYCVATSIATRRNHDMATIATIEL